MTHNIKTAAIIVAAGKGERFGSDVPKQYQMLGGRAILRRTVEVFLGHPQVDAVLVVINPDHISLYQQAVEGLDLLPPVQGGATRQASVNAGLEALEALNPQRVLIHDAARPFVSDAVINAVLDALAAHKAAIPAMAVADTLKRGAGGNVATTVSREGIFAVQTPQGFDYSTILALHRQAAAQDATDDAALCEQAGVAIALTAGESCNFKITTQDDMERAHQMIAYETRTGMGFDVHPFEAGDGVYLCGVKIPHTHKLKGHSDADAGLHALTDALLGAVGLGDIGQHFPPSDPQWKNADSGRFVEHAVKLIHEKGGSVVNADITIICEVPKVGPHRAAMQVRVAHLLGISEDRVNIKATTTEQLGFTGRKEGIAAQAVANVRLPYAR